MTTYEGGPRVPFLAKWPGKIQAGTTYDYPVLNLDLLPTMVTAAGGKVDPAWKLDGVDLLPYVSGANRSRPHETLYWRYGPQWAVRKMDYKLVVARGGGTEPELYDLAADLGEAKNLASSQPEKVKELQEVWNKWSAEQAPPSAPDSPAKKKANAKKKKKNDKST
jgi:arylsulfatase A-like enzyme